MGFPDPKRRRLGLPLVLVLLIIIIINSVTQALVSKPPSFLTKITSSTRLGSTRTSTSSTTSTSSSHIEFTDPETDCRVVLLGCLHGSQSSAADVEVLLEKEPTDAVVLELCAARCAELRRASQQQKESTTETSKVVTSQWLETIVKTSRQRGWTTAMAAAVLGGAAGLQTALSGLDKGSNEFTTALSIAEEQQCDVILADQTVDETLRRVGSLPSISFSMCKEGSFRSESQALATAVFGDATLMEHQIHMGKVLMRNEAVRWDVARLTLPPLLLAQLFVSVSQGLLDLVNLSGTEAAVNTSGATLSDLGLDLVTSALVLLFGYVTLALPAIRVILCERDIPLAEGVKAACRLAASQKREGDDAPARVVAVLGLLHVNGVAKQLLTTSPSP